jgi:hypothetical protein
MSKTTVKKLFTEGEVKAAITELPQRFYDAIVFAIEDQIIVLEDNLTPMAANAPGSLAQIAGGIYYLRHVLNELAANRELKE